MSDLMTHLELDRAEHLARRLAAAVSARRIYAPDHARTQTALHELAGDIRDAFRQGHERVRFTVTGGVLTHEGVPLVNGMTSHLAQLFQERDSGGVVFLSGIDDDEISQLIDWLAGRRPSGIPRRGEKLEILDPGAGEELTEEDGRSRIAERLPELKMPLEVQAKAIEIMEHVLAEARAGRHFDFGAVSSVARFAAEAARSSGTQLLAAAQLPRESAASFDHSVNTFLIATAMMEPVAHDAKELEIFAQAALLHDIGKSALPREITEKAGPLTSEEERLLRRHCEHGAKLLARMPHVDPLAVEVAYCHHMRDDGHGYPRPILPIKPGPVASMVQVGDLFDMIAEARPAQRGLSADEAVDRILRMPGMKSKRDLLRHFVRRATSSPPGSEVTIESGERGIVVEVFAETPHHPRVRVVKDSAGRAVAEPYVLDLREAGLETRPITGIYLKPR
ncbi:MAG TPA: HD domain-containing phosphohydrolase [Planctomycetota bacterium]|nr:HD domain-containing phosphohydrolase [Planctomycetota bacterium]